MAHIEYPMEMLEVLRHSNPWADKLYHEKKAFMESLEKKPKTKKQSILKRKVLKGKERQIMDATSTAHKVGDKAVITTDMNVIGRLSPKDKKALKASIMKAIKEHIGAGIRGGMVYDSDDEEELGKQPLVRDVLQNSRINKYVKEHPNINLMELITDNWDELPDDQVIKRYSKLNDIMDEIDFQKNPLIYEPIPEYKLAPYSLKKNMKKKQYNDVMADKARANFKEAKDIIYSFFNAKQGTGLYV